MYLHDDALVVSLELANCRIRWVLVDNGSSIDILLWDAFNNMGIDLIRLRPFPTLLKGFSGDAIQSVRAITLLVLARSKTRAAATMTDFLVEKAPLW